MNFVNSLKLSFFFCTAIVSGTAFAGFETVRSSSPVSPLVAAPSVRKPVSPAPALQVFEDRYIPDSVRKKYNLSENWFGESQSGQLPVPLQNDAPDVPLALPVVIVPDMPDVKVVAPVVMPVVVIDSWRARKGENIHDVLQRWAKRGNTDLMWATPDTLFVQKDFSFVGKFQDAVNQLIKREAGGTIHSQYRSEGLSPVMMEPASTVTTNQPPPADAIPETITIGTPSLPQSQLIKAVNPLAQIFVPEKPKESKPETRWFGLSGAPLAEVVQVWADDAGIRLIWQSEKNFALKTTISQVGHFEDAVFQALSQYDNEPIRPVGEVYKDPDSGQPVLLVRTDAR